MKAQKHIVQGSTPGIIREISARPKSIKALITSYLLTLLS